MEYDNIILCCKHKDTGNSMDISIDDLIAYIDKKKYDDRPIHLLPIITSKDITLSYRLYRYGSIVTHIDRVSDCILIGVPKGIHVNIRYNGTSHSFLSTGIDIQLTDRIIGSSIIVGSKYDESGLCISIMSM